MRCAGLLLLCALAFATATFGLEFYPWIATATPRQEPPSTCTTPVDAAFGEEASETFTIDEMIQQVVRELQRPIMTLADLDVSREMILPEAVADNLTVEDLLRIADSEPDLEVFISDRMIAIAPQLLQWNGVPYEVPEPGPDVANYIAAVELLDSLTEEQRAEIMRTGGVAAAQLTPEQRALFPKLDWSWEAPLIGDVSILDLPPEQQYLTVHWEALVYVSDPRGVRTGCLISDAYLGSGFKYVGSPSTSGDWWGSNFERITPRWLVSFAQTERGAPLNTVENLAIVKSSVSANSMAALMTREERSAYEVPPSLPVKDAVLYWISSDLPHSVLDSGFRAVERGQWCPEQEGLHVLCRGASAEPKLDQWHLRDLGQLRLFTSAAGLCPVTETVMDMIGPYARPLDTLPPSLQQLLIVGWTDNLTRGNPELNVADLQLHRDRYLLRCTPRLSVGVIAPVERMDVFWGLRVNSLGPDLLIPLSAWPCE